MNPDTTSGLYLPKTFCVAANNLYVLKDFDKKETEERVVRTASKTLVLAKIKIKLL